MGGSTLVKRIAERLMSRLGYLKYYFNNNLISEIFYSANAAPSPTLSGHNVPGALSDIDAGHYYLILGWQDVGTIAVDWVKVWQL